MSRNSQSLNKGFFTAVVSSNKRIGERFYRLKLGFTGGAAKAFAKAGPGQFAQLDLSKTTLPKDIPNYLLDASERNVLLRRPFSFCDITAKNDKTMVEILYCTVGPASLRMTTLSKGVSVNIIGPLGNGFVVPENKRIALLVCGGMGAGPLIHLAKTLKKSRPDMEVTAFVGAKTTKELPFEEIRKSQPADFARYGVKSFVSTDDGSLGVRGLVTYCLAEWLDENKRAVEDIIIYSCGPEMMLARMAEIAQKYNVDCQMSMERMMACGIGVCQSCAVECKVAGSKGTVYKLCCKDGPVFESRKVVFRL